MKKNTLEEEVKQCIITIDENYRGFQWDNRWVYGNWLAQVYYYVNHVTRLLSYAASKCNLEEERELHFRLLSSLSEEKTHDEMALNDLKALGLDLKNFPEMVETRNFYQMLIFIIETYGPIALLGYFAPQEGLAATKLQETCKFVKSVYGNSAATFLHEHCVLDVTHYRELLKTIGQLEGRNENSVRKGIYRSTELYNMLVTGMKKFSSTEKFVPHQAMEA